MKRAIFLSIALLIGSLAFSQEADFKKNELKINAGMLVAIGAPDITYERILNKEMSVGGSLMINFGSELDYDYSLLGFYRLYFGKKYAAGFFIEPHAALIVGKENFYDISGSRSNKNCASFGIGVATGYKLLTKRNLVGEIYLGIGRTIFGDYDGTYPHLGLSFGKRF